MIRLFIILLSFVGGLAQAADFGIEGGFRSQSGDYNSTGISTSSKTDYQIGGVGQFELSGPWRLRSGLMYTQRSLDFKSDVLTSSSGTATLTYFDVPVQIMYKFEDYGGVFLGPVLSMNLENSCSGTGVFNPCKINNANSFIVPVQVGATFKFAPQFGATLFYEIMSGKLSDDFKNFRAVGVNLLFTFD